jgi:hypothetical protein
MTTARDWELRCPTCGIVRDADAAGMMFVGKFRWPNRVLAWCSVCRWFRRATLERKTPGFPVVTERLRN